jgi:hypothetical protein
MPRIPTVGADIDAWGTVLNEYVQPPAANLVRYVSPDGSDSDDGRTIASPYATIQAAYDDLVTVSEATYAGQSGTRWGSGRINLLPGDHDVGTGLVLDAHNSVEIIGMRQGFGHPFANEFASRILTTNSSCTSLISWGEDNFITRGMRFRDICFVLGYGASFALINAIQAKATDYLMVEDCAFTTSDGNQSNESIYAVEQVIGATANDCAWGQLTNNICVGVGLLTMASDMGNHNGVLISHNTIFFNSSSEACINLLGSGSGGQVHGNYSTGTAMFCEIGDRDGWVFSGNSGESTGDVPYYLVSGPAQGCAFIGGTCTLPGTNGTWIEYTHASAHSNVVFAGNFHTTGSTGMKQKVVDTTSTFKNIVMSQSGPIVRRIVSGAGKTRLADTDFPAGANTPDGTHGVAVNTSDSKRYWCVRQNGTWYGVEVT